jgi:uncharacterized protein YdhG (YjbR/CyaY superfamily)
VPRTSQSPDRAQGIDRAAHVDEAAQAYIDGIDPRHRPLFDRIHGLVLAAYPEAAVTISYKMPTYRVGGRRLHLGVWKHGVSIYGAHQGRDSGFTARHPALKPSKGTIRLRPEDAAGIADDELSALVRASLEPGAGEGGPAGS